jgi:stress-induced-phosphoprotein 1
MIDVLGVAMGIDMTGFARPEGSDELPPGVSPEKVASTSRSPPPPTSPPKPSPPQSTPPPKVEEDVEMATEEDDEDVRAKKEAETAKKAGGEAYKKRNFEEAIKQFERAWELWPKDITFLTNLGGENNFFFSMADDLRIHSFQLHTLNKEILTNLSRCARKRWTRAVQ